MTMLRWGILSSSSFAVEHIIPALLQCEHLELVALSSRDADTAQQLATKFGIARAHDSYQELVDGPEIDVIYNPLPNHLHVPWSIKAMRTGKHVLCEKPLAMNAAETKEMVAARDETGKLAQEAFVIRHHPQWWRVRELWYARGASAPLMAHKADSATAWKTKPIFATSLRWAAAAYSISAFILW